VASNGYDIESGRQLSHEDPDSSTDLDTEECNNMISLPCRTGNDTHRLVSSTCAICLEEYKEGESIAWASNPKCIHCFHEECFVEAFTTRLAKDEECNQASSSWSCPMCRQCFLSTDVEAPKSTCTDGSTKLDRCSQTYDRRQ
jgi:hypothetical protein